MLILPVIVYHYLVRLSFKPLIFMQTGVQSLYGLHDAVPKGTAFHLFIKFNKVVLDIDIEFIKQNFVYLYY